MHKVTRRRLRQSFLLAALLLSASLGRAQVEQYKPNPTGELLYRVYCSNCHGESGKGNGPMARILRVKPADLRLIRARNGGVFPSQEIHRTIDGREVVRGHGSGEMPLWGLAFQQLDLDANQEREVEKRITALTDYLESIQELATGSARARD